MADTNQDKPIEWIIIDTFDDNFTFKGIIIEETGKNSFSFSQFPDKNNTIQGDSIKSPWMEYI